MLFRSKSVRIGGKTLSVDADSQAPVEYPAKDDVAYIPLVDFLKPQPRPEVKGRVIILAYDSDRFEPVETPAGKIRPHRAFYYALMSLHRQLR